MVRKLALTLTVSEYNRLYARARKVSFLLQRDIVVSSEPCEPLPVQGEEGGVTLLPACFVHVSAETDFLAGVGVGFLTAMSEGVGR